MSVPYKIQASQELLVGGAAGGKASDRIPMIARPFVSDRAKKTLDLVSSMPSNHPPET
jgi:acyl-CoA dehydrogenase